MKNRIFAMIVAALTLLTIVCHVSAESNENTIVYKTWSGKCYHKSTCGYLHDSKIAITLLEAVSDGLRPCSRCHPPKLIKQRTKTVLNTDNNERETGLPDAKSKAENELTEQYIAIVILALVIIITTCLSGGGWVLLRQGILLLCLSAFLEGYTSNNKSFSDVLEIILGASGAVASVFWETIVRLIKDHKQN